MMEPNLAERASFCLTLVAVDGYTEYIDYLLVLTMKIEDKCRIHYIARLETLPH